MRTAVYDSAITLTGMSSNEIEKIKADLTFDNPAYASVKKYSRYQYTRVPPHVFYFEEMRGKIKVPVGYDLTPYDLTEIKDNRVKPIVDYPPFCLTLRDSQVDAMESYFKFSESIVPKGSIQMPTGKGKSILGLYLASKLSCPTLIIVHKDDLVTGWKKDIKLAFDNKLEPGLIKASSRELGEQITIATIQTLNRLSEEELEELYEYFGVVIQDEMHHCPASSFSLVARFKARYKIGLTATPERADGLAHVMKLYFGDFCYTFEHIEDDKDILNAKVIVRKVNLYYEPVCRYHNRNYVLIPDYYPKGVKLPEGVSRVSSLTHAIRPRVPFHTIDDFVVKEISNVVCQDIASEFNKGHSCVVFFTQKEHCRIYQSYLTETLAIPEDSIGLYYGDNSDNQSVLEKAESERKFITLTTYAKATEGTNVKQWEVVFLVSSINNGKNVEQAVGRIRRRKPTQKIDPVLVYDYRTPEVYSMKPHGTTRDHRYTRLKFLTDLKATPKGLFSRGYR